MHTAAEKMADNLRLAIARVYRTGSSKGITHRKHAMLWLFQVFALTAGLYGCQVWATSSLTYDSSKINPTHVLILASWKDFWVSRKVLILTACSAKQVRCPFFSIGSDASYGSGTVYSIQTILFLRKLCGLTFLSQIEVIHELISFCTHPKFYSGSYPPNCWRGILHLCRHQEGHWTG